MAPCASSGIGFLLRKIYNVPFESNTTQVTKWIVLYIYKHKVNVSIRRVHKKKDFLAFDFSILKSLLEVRSELQALQVSIVCCLVFGVSHLMTSRHQTF